MTSWSLSLSYALPEDSQNNAFASPVNRLITRAVGQPFGLSTHWDLNDSFFSMGASLWHNGLPTDSSDPQLTFSMPHPIGSEIWQRSIFGSDDIFEALRLKRLSEMPADKHLRDCGYTSAIASSVKVDKLLQMVMPSGSGDGHTVFGWTPELINQIRNGELMLGYQALVGRGGSSSELIRLSYILPQRPSKALSEAVASILPPIAEGLGLSNPLNLLSENPAEIRLALESPSEFFAFDEARRAQMDLSAEIASQADEFASCEIGEDDPEALVHESDGSVEHYDNPMWAQQLKKLQSVNIVSSESLGSGDRIKSPGDGFFVYLDRYFRIDSKRSVDFSHFEDLEAISRKRISFWDTPAWDFMKADMSLFSQRELPRNEWENPETNPEIFYASRTIEARKVLINFLSERTDAISTALLKAKTPADDLSALLGRNHIAPISENGIPFTFNVVSRPFQNESVIAESMQLSCGYMVEPIRVVRLSRMLGAGEVSIPVDEICESRSDMKDLIDFMGISRQPRFTSLAAAVMSTMMPDRYAEASAMRDQIRRERRRLEQGEI